ncbi:hypothetical protein LRY60_03350 [Candidatus Woesebacteria bacterium]|nr:hypothetical protein [Candidatus Woesebacteria bacterium]
MRLTFPLLARESRSAWHTLTEPVSCRTLLTTKLTFGLFLASFLAMMIDIGWLLMPIPAQEKAWLAATSTLGVFFLVFLHTLLGFWTPQWHAGDQPDQLSTSLQGFITLGISLVFIALSVYVWMSSSVFAWLAVFFGSAVFIVVLMAVTQSVAIRRLEVSR